MQVSKFNLRQISGLVLVLSGLFILRIFLDNYDQVYSSLKDLNLLKVTLSGFLFLIYYYFRAFAWGRILKSLGFGLSRNDVLSVWFISEAARYMPGYFWSFVGRAILAKQKKVPQSITITSIALEITAVLLVTSLLSIFFIQDRVFAGIIKPVFAVSAIGLLIIFAVRDKVTAILKIVSTRKMTLNLKVFSQSLLLLSLAWLFYGLATFILIDSVAKAEPIFIFASIFAWLLGYLSLVTPTGLGIREGSLVVLLSPFLPVWQAALIAVLARVVLVTTESLNLTFWLFRYQQISVARILNFILNRWDILLLCLFVTAYITTFSTLSIMRHMAFASSYDLANMGQTVWNTLHGRIFTLSGFNQTVNRLEIHADLILILLAPLYLVWEQARTLLVSQSIALGLGAMPAYFIAREVFRPIERNSLNTAKIASLVIVLIYLLSPALEWVNIYDFHAVSFAIPLLLSAFYFALVKRWGWFFLAAILAILTKEQTALFVALLGALVLIVFKQRIGLWVMCLSIAWFIFAVFVLIPSFSPKGRHWGLQLFDYSPQGTIFEKISYLSRSLFNSEAKEYLFLLLKPFGFLPILGLPWLLLVLPELMINLISDNSMMRSISFHYTSVIIPGLVISTIYGLFYVWKFSHHFKMQFFSAALLIVFFFALRANYHLSPLPTTPSCWCLMYQVTDADLEFHKVLKSIPQEAKVASSSEVRAHLTQREYSYNLPGGVTIADYIAILDQNRIVGDYRPKEYEVKLIDELKNDQSFLLIYYRDHFYLFKRV